MKTPKPKYRLLLVFYIVYGLEMQLVMLVFSTPLLCTSAPLTRVGNFRQKNNSAEDGMDGTNGYFRRNSVCSAEQKISEFRSEPFRGRENSSEFRSEEQK
jgi:hypothetical protein